MTVAEIERWVLQHRWGSQRIQSLRAFLQRFTVVPSSPDLCRRWAEVTVMAQAAGRRIESADAWIAATALVTTHRCSPTTATTISEWPH
jgi:predicted nucleic acid-binding protein